MLVGPDFPVFAKHRHASFVVEKVFDKCQYDDIRQQIKMKCEQRKAWLQETYFGSFALNKRFYQKKGCERMRL